MLAQYVAGKKTLAQSLDYFKAGKGKVAKIKKLIEKRKIQKDETIKKVRKQFRKKTSKLQMNIAFRRFFGIRNDQWLTN